MTTDIRQPAHLVRALLLASVSMAMGAGAHVLAGGLLPQADGLAFLAAVVVAASGAVAVTRARMWLLLAYFVAVQAFLHHGFVVVGAQAGMAGHVHPADTSPAMFALHAAAAIVTSALVRGAEAGARAALDVCGTSLPALAEAFRPAATAGLRRMPVAAPALVTPRSIIAVRNDPHRGPPASARVTPGYAQA